MRRLDSGSATSSVWTLLQSLTIRGQGFR